MMTNPDPNHVDWLAFRYVAGEMNDEESARWELRLADDQTAREAVAAAVEMLQAMSQLPRDAWPSPRVVPVLSPTLVPAATRGRAARVWRIGLSASAAALLAFGAFAVSQSMRQDGSPTLRPLDVDEELATAWSLMRATQASESVDDASGDDAAAEETVVAIDEWPSSAGSDAIASGRPVSSTPSWMLAGMAGLVAEHDEPDATPDPTATKEL